MNVFWTKRSKKRYDEIFDYLESEFGLLVANKFKLKVLEFILLLSKFPKLGVLEVVDKKIYSFQLTRQTRIFYRINNNHISLLTFFDTRQNPDNRPI